MIAILDGYRESKQSWSELLLGLNHRGLTTSPKVAAADGALGFWVAARKFFPEMREQRCWVHKTANAVVTRDIPPLPIVGGNPARVLTQIECPHDEFVEEANTRWAAVCGNQSEC